MYIADGAPLRQFSFEVEGQIGAALADKLLDLLAKRCALLWAGPAPGFNARRGRLRWADTPSIGMRSRTVAPSVGIHNNSRGHRRFRRAGGLYQLRCLEDFDLARGR